MDLEALVELWVSEEAMLMPSCVEDLALWKKDLSEDRARQYLSTVAALMRRLILTSGTQTLRILSLKEDPYIEVHAAPGSTLMRESGEVVRVYSSAISLHVAKRCDVSKLWGTYAWYSIARSLSKAPKALPKLRVRL